MRAISWTGTGIRVGSEFKSLLFHDAWVSDFRIRGEEIIVRGIFTSSPWGDERMAKYCKDISRWHLRKRLLPWTKKPKPSAYGGCIMYNCIYVSDKPWPLINVGPIREWKPVP